jgi:hypothetical protein
MMTLKLNTHIFTPLLGKGGVMPKYSYYLKINDLESKKARGLSRKKPNEKD